MASTSAAVLALLDRECFQDSSPRQVRATLLDEGKYFRSISSMYRLLHGKGEGQERRKQCTHPTYARPELLATAPNQLRSWDITWMRGPTRLSYFYFYVVLDVFSRYIVGWLVAEEASAHFATYLIAENCCEQGIQPGELIYTPTGDTYDRQGYEPIVRGFEGSQDL